MDLTLHKNTFAKRAVTVVGLGVSNIPLIDFLLSSGAVVTGRDRKESGKFPLEKELREKGVRLILGEGYLEGDLGDTVFRSPGIRPDIPEFLAVTERGGKVTSEMELFFELCPAKIFAITGSDGKTTTTTVTEKILSLEHSTFLGGNIGKPLIGELESIEKDDIVVLELSSFQLQTMARSADIAAVTNITPNHLNWHTGMDEYTLAKTNIFRHQSKSGRLVLNYDNEITRSLIDEAKGEVFFFSSTSVPPHENAVYLKGDDVILRYHGCEEKVLDRKNIKLPGRHNLENYMTAAALTYGYAKKESLIKVASEFGGVKHRLELVRELDGVKYYNSSIDSSPTRTLAALSCFDTPVVIILGGYDKNLDHSPLAEVLARKARAVVYTGAAMEKIYGQTARPSDSSVKYVKEPDFEKAVLTASALAQSGDAVLLSPACASFDAFSNFEERGERFRQIINGIS